MTDIKLNVSYCQKRVGRFVSKDRKDAGRRMREAALELFHEKGYDRTTTAEIAARAGVTERTFFRHFPDKREVLFNEAELGAKLHSAIANAPPSLAPLVAVIRAFQALSPMFEENLRFAQPAAAVIAQTPALQERQLAKAAAITEAITEALRLRGVDPALARLAAGTAMAITGHGLQTWVQDPSVPLANHFDSAFQALMRLSESASKH